LTAAAPLQRYVVELPDPPLALYDGRELSAADRGGPQRLLATAPHYTGDSRLDRGSAAALDYLEYLAARHEEFRLEAALLLGRTVAPVHRYRTASNGMALDLTEAEAAALAQSPLAIDRARHAAPAGYGRGAGWIGAGEVWNGLTGFRRRAVKTSSSVHRLINWNIPRSATLG
jgi:hypothetical protein